mmetsp:Transcript_23233/g.65080  ORF Transcript_23233/g.65080 Transcript_23233/m.65080 type:complete len:203 (+) Transcript_23233:1808-2416(+)
MCPCLLARSNAFDPAIFLTLFQAPAFRSTSQTLACPYLAASVRAVSADASHSETDTLASSSALTRLTLPRLAASRSKAAGPLVSLGGASKCFFCTTCIFQFATSYLVTAPGSVLPSAASTLVFHALTNRAFSHLACSPNQANTSVPGSANGSGWTSGLMLSMMTSMRCFSVSLVESTLRSSTIVPGDGGSSLSALIRVWMAI